MQPESSFWCSKQPASCSWLELRLLKSILIISPLIFLSQSGQDSRSKPCIYLSSSTCHMPNPSYRPWVSYPNHICWFNVMKFPIMNFSPVCRHFPLLGTNFLRSILYSKALCYWSSLRLTYQVPRKCTVQSKLPVHSTVQITSQYIVIFIFCFELNSNTDCPECNLLLISSCMKFWLGRIRPKYFKFSTFSKDFLPVS